MPVWAVILVIIAALICCGLCAYGISTAVHRTRDRRAQDANVQRQGQSLPYHAEWQPGPAEIAAAGGAADGAPRTPMDQSREAHRSAAAPPITGYSGAVTCSS